MPTIPQQTFDNNIIPETNYILVAEGDFQPDNIIWHAKLTNCCVCENSTNHYKVVAGQTSSSAKRVRTGEALLTSNYTHNGKRVYYTYSWNSADLYIDGTQVQLPNNSTLGDFARTAWLMVYGGYNGYSVTYVLENCVGDSNNPTIIPLNATLTNMQFTPNEGYYFHADSINIFGEGYPSGDVVYNFNILTGALQVGPLSSNIEIHISANTTPHDPYELGGESDEGGGTGDFDLTSDEIDFPTPPTFSAVDTGFITLFNPSLSELQALASYMWNGSLFDISTWQKLFADPMDAILGLSIVPVAVPDGGSSNIKVGNISTSVSMNKAASQYVTVDCGVLNVNEYWGSYLDYEPYTKAEIYLPYCGIHPISIDDIMGKSVHVKYNVDILSGACCAMVKCNDSVLYSFIGQCASSIPISGTDFTQMINGIISAAVSIGSMVASGGATAPLAIPSLANTAVNSMKPSIEKSGAMGGTGGMLAIQKPYLILTRPKQALPSSQNKYTGYPSFITCNLSELSGYTEIEKIHLDGFTGTEFELQETLKLLEMGVIF